MQQFERPADKSFLEKAEAGIRSFLTRIYGAETAETWYARFLHVCSRFRGELNPLRRPADKDLPISGEAILNRHSAILITYADSLYDNRRRTPSHISLPALHEFLKNKVGDAVSTIHLLPFYPSTSDDGFSIADYLAVDPAYGSWDDIADLSHDYLLMFDLVANHISRSSLWIQNYAEGNPEFSDFVLRMDGSEDVSRVFRPRALPLSSPLQTADGEQQVWTTFSEDQIDLNYRNPAVLLKIMEILLTYIVRGAALIRLDAIAFIWKELGTSCIHHPKTHAIIQFMRWTVDLIAPGTGLITETNVPHQDNISYFGSGTDEALMVYNFPLPPLVLHTFITQDPEKLRSWARTLDLPSPHVTFFNFLASHDGIGLIPAQGILSEEEITRLAKHIQAQGGYVSYRHNADGSRSPYELNCSYVSALSGLKNNESVQLRSERFLASQAVMLSLKGIPGIYVHSLLGSENWNDSPDLAEHPRSINREKLNCFDLTHELADPESLRSQIFHPYRNLLNIRKREPAFLPDAGQLVLQGDNPFLFSLLRIQSMPATRAVLCLINVTDSLQHISLSSLLAEADGSELCQHMHFGRFWTDVLSDPATVLSASDTAQLEPYQIMWLVSETD